MPCLLKIGTLTDCKGQSVQEAKVQGKDSGRALEACHDSAEMMDFFFFLRGCRDDGWMVQGERGPGWA